jgi:hypothetical protein
MKKLLLHIILMSYAVVVFKPVLPFINDFIGHVFFLSKHMATVHVENGKYHVHYETAKDAKEEKSDKNAAASKKDNSANDQIVIIPKLLTPYAAIIIGKKYFAVSSSTTLSGISNLNYPPPRI